MVDHIRFGPAGNPPSFYQAGGKTSLDIPAWLAGLQLGAYEYQCVRGVNISEKMAVELGGNAQKHNIVLSLHAPYYINLAAATDELTARTEQHLLRSMAAAIWMGASKVVFHPGSIGGSRKDSLEIACDRLQHIRTKANKLGFGAVALSPETMGKRNQLGSLDDILQLCTIEGVSPTVDFGHLHAVSGGKLTSESAYAHILDLVEGSLGNKALRQIHIHFSPIEFTAGGEKKHRTLADQDFGPDFLPLALQLKQRNLSPTIICESAGSQAEDALTFQQIWQRLDLL